MRAQMSERPEPAIRFRPVRFAIVGFDLDGTLLDTAPDIALALNHALRAAGRPALPLDEVRPMIGGGAKKLLAKALGQGARVPEDELAPLYRMLLDHYAAHIAASHVYVLEAEPPGGIAGLVVLTKGPDHLFLDNIAVDPAQHGKGIGRRLLDFVEAEARRNGFDQIRLYTNALMTENLALYPRLGYRETERRIEKGYDRIYFTKFLA